MIPFLLNENQFSFFVADHLLVGQLCTNPKKRYETSIISESDTMFPEWDRSCASAQLMPSTDPSYDNRTIASTFKMKIWIVKNNWNVPRLMKTKFPVTVMVFGVVSSEGHIMPSHIFEVGLKVNTNVYLNVLKCEVIPWYNQVAGGRPWVWQQNLAPVHMSKETQASLQKEYYDFVLFSYCPLLLWPEPAGLLRLVENIINMTSHNTKASLIAAIRRVFAELPIALLEKTCSQFWIRIEAVIEAEGGYLE